MGFGEFLKRERTANERGEITDEQYAANLEQEASARDRSGDRENAKYLRSRARVVRSRPQTNQLQAEKDKRKKK